MPVIAVVNRKGGSGKTTLATHLAVSCAAGGAPVLLADVDRQQSTQAWLRRRAGQTSTLVKVKGRALEPNSVVRPPAGFSHVILDTPGGLRGFDLMRVVMYADAILMPVGSSMFDRDSTAACFAELKTMPRVASGRCRVAAIGMRLDARTKADEMLRDWAASQQLPFVGVLRETQAYVRSIERGLTLFDLPAAKVEADRRQWQPILDWLEPVLQGENAGPITLARPTAPMMLPRISTDEEAALAARSIAARQAQANVRRPVAPVVSGAAPRPTIAARFGKLMDALVVPRFLQREP